jgi:tRNA-2-methylthio-N6-dimethylallyladenosine synthase
MNVKDSERIAGLLREEGYASTDDPARADVILVNTCTVREKPEQKVLGVLGRWKSLKDADPSLVIGVCGCVAQQKGQELLDKLPYLDLAVGTQMIHRLPELVERAKTGERIAAKEWLESGDPDLFKVPREYAGNQVTSFVSIMQGCDNRCAYCIVPMVRGPATCRKAERVLAEIESLSRSGVREVTLLGQNVNAFRDQGVEFHALLRMAADVPGIQRVRFTTSHPKDLDQKLIEAMAGNPRIMEHIHLPVQAGSDKVLTAMKRGYTREHYLALVARLRQAMPGIGLTTDLIVGFPGESEEDFQETLSLLSEVRYDETFSFRYSRRPGTEAEGLPGQVPEDEKYDRLYRLQDLQRKITSDKNKEQVGSVHEVLIEGPGRNDPGRMTGRTRTNRITHFFADDESPGDLVKVRITRALKHSLEGKIVAEGSAAESISEEESCLWR